MEVLLSAGGLELEAVEEKEEEPAALLFTGEDAVAEAIALEALNETLNNVDRCSDDRRMRNCACTSLFERSSNWDERRTPCNRERERVGPSELTPPFAGDMPGVAKSRDAPAAFTGVMNEEDGADLL